MTGSTYTGKHLLHSHINLLSHLLATLSDHIISSSLLGVTGGGRGAAIRFIDESYISIYIFLQFACQWFNYVIYDNSDNQIHPKG